MTYLAEESKVIYQSNVDDKVRFPYLVFKWLLKFEFPCVGLWLGPILNWLIPFGKNKASTIYSGSPFLFKIKYIENIKPSPMVLIS